MSGELLNRHTASRAQKEAAVYIGFGTPWANPHGAAECGGRQACVDRFEQVTLPTLDLTPLLGKDLLCSCAPLTCHGDPILWALYRGL